MGGQACVFYGAAEFSRDTDMAILASPERRRPAFVRTFEVPSRSLLVIRVNSRNSWMNPSPIADLEIQARVVIAVDIAEAGG